MYFNLIVVNRKRIIIICKTKGYKKNDVHYLHNINRGDYND